MKKMSVDFKKKRKEKTANAEEKQNLYHA